VYAVEDGRKVARYAAGSPGTDKIFATTVAFGAAELGRRVGVLLDEVF
jgi:hypothetical protein